MVYGEIVLLDVMNNFRRRIHLQLHAYTTSSYTWAFGVVVSMFDLHRSDWDSNPGRDGELS